MDRIAIEGPLPWMQELPEDRPDDKGSCLWCHHICSIEGVDGFYICALNKIYYNNTYDGDTLVVFDRLTCNDHILSKTEIIPVFKGTEEAGIPQASLPGALFAIKFS